MNKPIVQIIGLGIFLIFANLEVNGQILQTRSDIIIQYGPDYESVPKGDDGIDYIYYDKEFTSEQSGTFNRRTMFYFFNLSDEIDACIIWEIIEPSSETNRNVAHLIKKNLIDVGYMKWKDFGKNILYEIEVDFEEGLCITKSYYDFSVNPFESSQNK